MLSDQQDAYGHELYNYYVGNEVYEIVERKDGFIQAHSGPENYFASFEKWPARQQEAMVYARGMVLDVGCGAGRVALYLQDKGMDVLAIDNSPLALEVCRLRGVKHTSPTPITRVSKDLGNFDTIVLLGNNFGLLGDRQRARWLLRRFQGMTTPEARIIAESNDIYQTDNPEHLAYQQSNRDRGRMSGQIRLRVRTGTYKSPWFDYLMVSAEEMADILVGTGWKITKLIQHAGEPQYVAIIEKYSN